MPSTVIAETAYDPDTQTLSVWFRPSGRRYDYFEVPSAVYDALRRSPSKGRYFNAHIRDGYGYNQIERPRTATGRIAQFFDHARKVRPARHAGISRRQLSWDRQPVQAVTEQRVSMG